MGRQQDMGNIQNIEDIRKRAAQHRKSGAEQEESIKRKAGQDMVVLLQNWKERLRRYRIYRFILSLSLAASCTALVAMLYYQIDSSIPSVINVRAGEEESLHLGVPARGEIISVSDQGTSNIPQGAVDIDLSKTFTLKTALESDYQMQVKLFGFITLKNVEIQVIEDQELIPVGAPIGIYVKTDGVLVVGTGEFQGPDGVSCSPGKYILKSGD